jgi:hypothetical protein
MVWPVGSRPVLAGKAGPVESRRAPAWLVRARLGRPGEAYRVRSRHGLAGQARLGLARHVGASRSAVGPGLAGQARLGWLRFGRAGPGAVGVSGPVSAWWGGAWPAWSASQGRVVQGAARSVEVRRVRARSGKAGKAWWVSSGHGRSRRGVVGFGEAGMAWLGASGRVVVCPGLVRRVRRGLLRRVESWLGPSGPGWAGCGWLGWAGPVAAWHGTSRRVSSRPVLVGFGEAGAASRGRSGQVPASPVLARQAGYPAIETRSVPRAQARPHHLEVAHHL